MNKEFERCRVSQSGVTAMTAVNIQFDSLLDFIKDHVPEGRMLSIVKTKLEEASFFAAKGVALNPEYQEKV